MRTKAKNHSSRPLHLLPISSNLARSPPTSSPHQQSQSLAQSQHPEGTANASQHSGGAHSALAPIPTGVSMKSTTEAVFLPVAVGTKTDGGYFTDSTKTGINGAAYDLCCLSSEFRFGNQSWSAIIFEGGVFLLHPCEQQEQHLCGPSSTRTSYHRQN